MAQFELFLSTGIPAGSPSSVTAGHYTIALGSDPNPDPMTWTQIALGDTEDLVAHINTLRPFPPGEDEAVRELWVRRQCLKLDPTPPLIADFLVDRTEGPTGTTVTFTSTSTGPDIVSHRWEFETGTERSGEVVRVTFPTEGTFGVKLTVTTASGATDICKVSQCVHIANPTQPLVASFRADKVGGPTGTTIKFTSTSTGENIVDWQWTFSTGTVCHGEVVSETFSTEGDFDVELTVTTASGATKTCKMVKYVHIANPTQPLVASFRADKVGGPTGTTIKFTSTSTGENIVDWQWTFSTGTVCHGEVVSETFSTEGDFDVELTVTTASGATKTCKMVKYVHIAEPPAPAPPPTPPKGFPDLGLSDGQTIRDKMNDDDWWKVESNTPDPATIAETPWTTSMAGVPRGVALIISAILSCFGVALLLIGAGDTTLDGFQIAIALLGGLGLLSGGVLYLLFSLTGRFMPWRNNGTT